MTLFIPRNLLKLAQVCAPEAARFALGAVRVVDPLDGRYHLEATDGKRLVIATGSSRAPAAGAKETFAALEGVANSGTEVLLAAADWSAALKLGSKKVDRVGLVINPGVVTFAAGEQTYTAKPVEGRFPDTKLVLPRTAPVLRIEVNPQLLAGLLGVFAAVNPERATLLWYGPERPVGIMAAADGGQFLDALLVPLS